tara:strand:+ start:496 stop:693 length:198 start_codon:yes stop_codon:yes gene_type:complete
MSKKEDRYNEVLGNVLDEIISMLFDKHFVLEDIIEMHMYSNEGEDLKDGIVAEINKRLAFKKESE